MAVVTQALGKALIFAEVITLRNEYRSASHDVAVGTPVETVTDAAAGIVAVVTVVTVKIQNVGIVKLGVQAVFVGNFVYFVAAVGATAATIIGSMICREVSVALTNGSRHSMPA